MAKLRYAAAALLSALLLLCACSKQPEVMPEPTFSPAPTAEPSPTPQVTADPEAGESYTLRAAVNKLPANWSPLEAETRDEIELASLLTGRLVAPRTADLETGGLLFSFELALSVTDVTADHIDDLLKYNASLGGRRLSEIREGFVYEIELDPTARFASGEPITADTHLYSVRAFLDPELRRPGAADFVLSAAAPAGSAEYLSGLGFGFDSTVGLYKTGEYKLVCVCSRATEREEFLYALSRPLLVEPRLHASLGADYGKGAESMDYSGPYYLERTEEKTAVLARSPLWSGWQADEEGAMFAYSREPINGVNLLLYQTTRVQLSAMPQKASREAYLAGELDIVMADPELISEFGGGDRLLSYPATSTDTLIFNTREETLLALDSAGQNRNSVVLSNENFRRAISLAVDRVAVSAEMGGSPALGLIPSGCLYEPFTNITAHYRESEHAMESLLALYGLPSEEGEEPTAVSEAYLMLTGCDPARASECLRLAFEELSEAGLYRKGDNIVIRCVCSEGSVPQTVVRAMDQVVRALNAAAEGTGFGRLAVECVGGVAGGSYAVSKGAFAMGWDTWQADELRPFESLQSCFDPDLYELKEAASFDPESTRLTILFAGREQTASCAEWARSIVGSGRYAHYPQTAKLVIASALENELLSSCCRIPLCERGTQLMISGRIGFVKRTRDPFCSLSGLEFLVYDFSDSAWEEYLR
ncbi:MAG: hypothetical protein J6P98_03100 [Clostridia bacterium]|nr:hypothetical protein [Clostridia bacterium]